MKRIGITAVGLLAVFALSAFAAASAFALPDISVSLKPTTEYPLHAQGSKPATPTILGTASGVSLEGTGVTLLLLTKELSSLGEFTSTFTSVHEPGKAKEECSTTGDAKGVVLVTGIFHVVLTATLNGSLASLFLVKETEIICPKLEIVVKGSVISTLKVGPETEEITKLSGKLLGTKGKQELTEYVNDGGTISKAALLSNAGAGFVFSDENVNEEITLEVLGTLMFVITSR